MINNKHLRWAKIIFGNFCIITSVTSSYLGILGHLDTFIEHEGLKGILSFCLVLLFIWGSLGLSNAWIIDPGRSEFLNTWRDDADKSNFD